MITGLTNDQIRLAARPTGLPTPEIWQRTSEPVADPGDGGVVVKLLYLSLDPAMRGWLSEQRSYIPPVAIGEVMRAIGVGRVVASHNPAYAVGDAVSVIGGVQHYVSLPTAVHARAALHKIDLGAASWTQWLNVLGLPGMTAYFGLKEVGLAKAGETLVVSGAAGAVGQTTGQLGKILGLRVIGIAGGPTKCDYVTANLGFDACVDYKAGDVHGQLKQHCPDGVDVYFDNVGGDILDAALARLRRRARVVICGAISQYNNTDGFRGPKNYMSLLINRARMEGFVVFDYADRYHAAIAELAGYLAAGRLKSREEVATGLDGFHDALLRLFRGDNLGKQVLQIAEDA